MKALHTITQIAQLLGRHKSTVSRELRRNVGFRGYRPKQACELARKRSESSRNARTIAPSVKEQVNALLQLQWSPEQIEVQIPGRDALEQRGLRYYFFHLLQEYWLARFPDVQIEVHAGLFHGGISQTPLTKRTQST
jgi:Helix-turn-helix domain